MSTRENTPGTLLEATKQSRRFLYSLIYELVDTEDKLKSWHVPEWLLDTMVCKLPDGKFLKLEAPEDKPETLIVSLRELELDVGGYYGVCIFHGWSPLLSIVQKFIANNTHNVALLEGEAADLYVQIKDSLSFKGEETT